MKTILNFLERIKKQKKKAFLKTISEFKNNTSADGWNGNVLNIIDKNDIFLYLSEDKKTIKSTIGEYEPRIPFSYLVYLCHVDYVAKYINGGLIFIGLYNSDFIKVNEIPFGNLKIIGFIASFSFEARKNPDFYFELKHEEGRKNYSYIGNPYQVKSCQGVIDGIWELEKFYNNWYKELKDFENNWYEIRSRSPKSLM